MKLKFSKDKLETKNNKPNSVIKLIEARLSLHNL